MRNEAERLLDVAAALKKNPDRIVTGEGLGDKPELIARTALALVLAGAPLHVQLRALLEDWDMARVVRELH